MRRLTILLMAFTLVALTLVPLTQAADSSTVPEKKQTTLGLYVTAKEAFEMWHKTPETVNILDCRTPEEYNFVGHATMAVNIPSKFMTYEFDAEKKHYKMKDNPDFVAMVEKVFAKDATIMIMCRSGARSAASVNKLAEAGYTQVYNIIDGFEGDKVSDDASYYKGQRLVNGWKNSGAPWGYGLAENQVYKVAP